MFICNDCPRNCNVDRDIKKGFCLCSTFPTVVRAAPHFGEEPCISGTNGSGAVFFSGCNLKCAFCQNMEISRGNSGKQADASTLSKILLKLQDTGVHNINLVTGTHFTRTIAKALEISKLSVPVIWNSSGYEKVESLKMLDGLVSVYMPDYKYSDKSLAKRYSQASDYPEIAASAIIEMFRQRGSYSIENGLLKSGVLIRHLILPSFVENTMGVIDFVADSFPEDSVLFSLMSQFTPMGNCDIKSTVTEQENNDLIHYMKVRKLSGFTQELSSSGECYIPEFDLTGVDL